MPRVPGGFNVRRPDRSVRMQPGEATLDPGMRAQAGQFTDVTSPGYAAQAAAQAERGGAMEFGTSVEAEGDAGRDALMMEIVGMVLATMTGGGAATAPITARRAFERLALGGRRRHGAGAGSEVRRLENLAMEQGTGAYGMGRANRMTEPDIANWYLSRGAPFVPGKSAGLPGPVAAGRGPWRPNDPRTRVEGFSGQTGGWGRPDAPAWDMSHLTRAQRKLAFDKYTRDRAAWLAAQ